MISVFCINESAYHRDVFAAEIFYVVDREKVMLSINRLQRLLLLEKGGKHGIKICTGNEHLMIDINGGENAYNYRSL